MLNRLDSFCLIKGQRLTKTDTTPRPIIELFLLIHHQLKTNQHRLVLRPLAALAKIVYVLICDYIIIGLTAYENK